MSYFLLSLWHLNLFHKSSLLLGKKKEEKYEFLFDKIPQNKTTTKKNTYTNALFKESFYVITTVAYKYNYSLVCVEK